tara:strand:+ start:150 stop:1298 length:1149 start_codon:yes stop_codon:yes gene_type:complete
MKKIFLVIFLVFGYNNIVIAEIYEFNKCYISNGKTVIHRTDQVINSTRSSWTDDQEQGNKNNFIDKIFTINLINNTITQTVLRTREQAEKMNQEFENIGAGNDLEFMRVNQVIYNITTYSAGFITGEALEQKSIGDVIYKIYFNISEGTADLKKVSYHSSGTKVVSMTLEITCEGENDNSKEVNNISSGTAFFITKKGHLLTNNHVVEGCELSKIIYQNVVYETKLIAKDKNLDLALLKSDLKPKSFFYFSKDDAKKLNKIYVAGYPFGKGLSDDLKISSGIVSALKGFEDNSNEIQIDAPINPGNSGGPIIDINGELVAVAVSGLAKDQTEGINFGIKSSAAESFLKANKINPKKNLYSKSKNNDLLLEILEEGTVYTYCD